MTDPAPLPEPTHWIALDDGLRSWYRAGEPGIHGQGVYTAGEVVAEVARAVAEERGAG